MNLLKRPLNDKDSLALQLHVSYIEQNPNDPVNPIMKNFCKRVGCDLNDLVRIVLKGFWMEVSHKLKRDRFII